MKEMERLRSVCMLSVLGWLMVLTVLAGGPLLAYRLPDTGQTQCYDGDGNVIPCPAAGQRWHGQDGNYTGPQPAFRDNGNGTVTDLNTGLMWQRSDAQNDTERSWQKAVDYCGALTLAGHSDWRLPSVSELTSLTNIGRYGPAIDTNYFPDCRSSYYWSGSTGAYYSDGAWSVSFDGGYVNFINWSRTLPVRCVRVGP